MIQTYSQFISENSSIEELELFNSYLHKWEEQFPILQKLTNETSFGNSYKWIFKKEFSQSDNEGKLFLTLKTKDENLWSIEYALFKKSNSTTDFLGQKPDTEFELEYTQKKKNIDYKTLINTLEEITENIKDKLNYASL